METVIENAIKETVAKMAKFGSAVDLMQSAQAVLNLTNALAQVKIHKSPPKE